MPGKIVDEILALLQEKIVNIDKMVVDRVVRGLGYTAVSLNSGHVGICYTFQTENLPHHCQINKRAGKLAHSYALELARLARSWEISESVVGVATLNALSAIVLEKSCQDYVFSKGNLLDEIEFLKSDVVAFVGNIEPLIRKVESSVKKIYVLEREFLRREPGVLPDTACEQIIPTADVAILTGTTIVNGTLERLLELSKKAREVAIVGASASTLPDPIFARGATIVGGIKVLNPDRLMQIVAEGGGTKQLKEAVEFINLKPRAHK